MAQDILITPGSGEPQILFRGSGINDTPIELNVLSSYQSANGSGTALLFEGTEGQLFAITDNLSSGVIFSVADIAGLPLIEADASGDVRLIEYGRYVGVGTGVPVYQLDVFGTGRFSDAVIFPDGVTQTIAYTGQINSGNWVINVTGLTDSISGGQTVIFTGLGSTDITYDEATNTISISGDPSQRIYTTVTGDNTLSINSDIVFIDSTAGPIIITLPLASGNGGKQIIFKRSVGNNSVQLSGNGSETIDGDTTWGIDYLYDSYSIISDNQNWYIL